MACGKFLSLTTRGANEKQNEKKEEAGGGGDLGGDRIVIVGKHDVELPQNFTKGKQDIKER